MISDLKPYPAMKDSGVPWLGMVPEHWKVEALRRKLRLYDGIKIGPFGSQLKLDQMSTHGFKVYGQANVIAGDFVSGTKYVDKKKFDELSACEVRPGDLVLTMMGTHGRCTCVPDTAVRGIMDSHLLRLRVDASISATFAALVIDRAPYVSEQVSTAAKGSIMQGLNSRIVKDLSLLVPPLPEQAAIVCFLDHADRQIRRYIRAKQKLIKLLEEQKQAIIHRAVTRGLDPNVRLKPSGVESLGDVPEHWSRIAIRQLAAPGRSTFVNGPFGSDLLTTELTNVGVPVVYIRDISGGTYRRVSPAYVTEEKAAELEFCRVTPGDVLVAKVGDPPGTAATYPSGQPDGIVTQDVIRIRPDTTRVIAEYLATYLNSQAGRIAVGPVVVESTRGRVSLPDFKAVPVLLPPLAEQSSILEAIASDTGDILSIATRTQREIDLLHEYRTRLVADVVAGKLDVRAAAARLPDEAEEPEPLDEIDAEGEEDELSAGDTDELIEEVEA